MSRKSRRKKFIRKPKETEAQKKARAKRSLIIICSVIVLIVAAVVVSYLVTQNSKLSNIALFDQTAGLPMEQVVSGTRDSEISA